MTVIPEDLDANTDHFEEEQTPEIPSNLPLELVIDEKLTPVPDSFRLLTKIYTQLVLVQNGQKIAQLSKKLGFEILQDEALKTLFYRVIETAYHGVVDAVGSKEYLEAQQRFRTYYRDLESLHPETNVKKLLDHFEKQEERGEQILLEALREDATTMIRNLLKSES
jgi:hypothetical protein